MRRVQLECIVFKRVNGSIEYLLMKRIQNKGGFWQPPCGGLEEGDKSNLDAAFRELKEEANINKEDVIKVLENVHEFTIDKHYLTKEPISPIHEFVFGFEVKKDFNISIENNIYPEHEEVKWVQFDKAISLLKWQNNKDAFVKINDLLHGKSQKALGFSQGMNDSSFFVS